MNGPSTKFPLSNNKTILAPNLGSSSCDPIHQFKDKNNNSIIIAGTGHTNLEVFTSSGGSLPLGGRCDTCKRDFEHQAIGYPVHYQENLLLVGDAKNGKYEVLYSFWLDGEFCRFECCLYHINRLLQRPVNHRDNSIRNSEYLLKFLYKLMYPSASPLREAPPPGLLKHNKGPLELEKWEDEKHIYTKNDRILLIPVKVEYLQEKNLGLIGPVTIMGQHPK
jgi:hypothetical protein